MRQPMLSRSRLLLGASLLCVAASATSPARAQLAGLRSQMAIPSLPANAIPAPGATPNVGPVTIARDPASSVARQLATQMRLANTIGLVTQAQTAARAAAAALASSVPNGLATGGLQLVANPVAAASDPTGLNTLQNALAPTQSVTNGQTTVTVTQTDSRALISWDTFNVGRETTLVFDQKVNGVSQRDWVAFNRIVGQIDPATGLRNPNLTPAPSQILGRIQADGTVVVINPAGVFFQGTSQLRAGSLLVSTLEFGGFGVNGIPTTAAARNRGYLSNGLILTDTLTFQSAGVPATTPFGAIVVAEPNIEGNITVAAGADLAVGDAGTLFLAAPTVTNAGSLAASNGSVLLAAGRTVVLGTSTGSVDTGGNADVRGLFVVLSTSGSYVDNTGIISSPRGYVQLQTNNGAILQNGLIRSTTSVSRNGFIDLIAPDVRLFTGSAIAITPDTDGQTIPQAPDSVAAFKTSRVSIGALSLSSTTQGAVQLPNNVEIDANALVYAPGGRIEVGLANASSGRVFVDTGAIIDAGGIKDFVVPASRNQITIGPAKRNDLRDTPNYREPLTTEEIAARARGETVRFTLNGTTIYVDPRRSGVRADGVAWVGSPLIEAGSYYQNVGVTAAELLTRGGSVTLGGGRAIIGINGSANLAGGDVTIKPGATIDVSGGFVRYAAGPVQTSQLITRGGRIVDIGNADPNGDYVGLVNPFTVTNSRFGTTDQFPNATLQGITQSLEYTEGRDAGSLTIGAPSIALDGTVYAQAYAGTLQRSDAVRGTVAGTDGRSLQAVPSQLPSGGALIINPAVDPTGDILVTQTAAITPLSSALAFGQSVSLDATGALVRPATRDPASRLPTERLNTIELAGATLSEMGLGALSLNTTGQLTITRDTLVTLAPGGAFGVIAGRRVLVDGTVSAPSGRIDVTTYAGDGSVFVVEPSVLGAYDIVVNGTLSAAGRFVNDFGEAPDRAEGGGFTGGGSISIFAAPRIFTAVGAPANASIDISGSILINPGALVDVSSGAAISATGAVSTGARGGNLSLYDETAYAQLARSTAPTITRETGFRVNPDPGQPPTIPLNPATINARVTIAPGTVRAAGFAGGGVFNLTTPAFTFGDGIATVGTQLPLNFLSSAGFASATIQVLKTSLFVNRITTGLGGYNALLDTNTVIIGAGQTLNLSQARFTPLLSSDQVLALRDTATGGSLYSVLSPTVPTITYDQLPIALSLTGLNELDVLAGGLVTGAPGASVLASKIFNAGTIALKGGNVTTAERLPSLYVQVSSTGGVDPGASGIGVHRLSDALATRANGDIFESDPNAFGVLGGSPTRVITNRELIIDRTLSRPIYLLGRLNASDGIVVAPSGVIDVSGASIRNPRATLPNGAPTVDGRLFAGGSVQASGTVFGSGGLAQNRFGSVFADFQGTDATNTAGRTLTALPGSTIDISGASDSYARLTSAGTYGLTPEWSDAGTLGLRAGGSIAGATVRAAGGDTRATGGTLIVRDLRLAQADPATPGTGAIAADQIKASGFDTVIAEASLGTVGAVDLSLRRAFILQSGYTGSANTAENLFGVTVSATGALSIEAPIIRFASITQTVPTFLRGTPGTATARFSGNAVDVQGGVLFDRSIGAVTLNAVSDLRLIGAQPIDITVGNTIASPAASLRGQLIASGNLTIAAAQVYPTTGTTFTVASSAATGTIRFARSTADTPATPYSAGTNLLVQAATIEQGGVVRAPLGTLTLGATAPLIVPGNSVFGTSDAQLAPATATLRLAAGSITSVSADGLSIPYGITTDQVEYFFTPTIANELTAPPAAILRLSGANIALDSGATVNLKGGGDVYAYEFVPGIGGSRDVLDRFNQDQFSSRNGLQYADGRQVYAIVPSLQNAGLALNDPIYSADYAALTSASQVGRRVYLDAAPGLAAGWYTLLPARYALLPGGLRVVEQPEFGTTVPGASAKLLDGTTVVGGYYGVAGTSLRESERRTFAVQTQTTFRRESTIATTSANTIFPARATRNGFTAPRIPLDAGRLIINAITGITANATFQTNPGAGGRASTADLGGTNFQIVGTAPATPAAGTITITANTLQQLNSASLLIGGTRTDNVDGTTTLDLTGRSILIAGDTVLSAPELLFAVDGSGASIRFADGASVTATGTTGDTRTGDYLIAGSATGQTGAGAIVRLSTGPERLVTRANVQNVAATPLLDVGLAHLQGNALLLDSSGDLRIASPATGTADITARAIAIGAGAVSFTGAPVVSGLRITPQIVAAFAGANTLNIRSRSGVSFAPGTYGFGAVTLDTPVLALIGTGGAVTLNTGALRLANSAAQALTCASACGTGTLAVNASSIAFGSGQIRETGFGGGIALASPGGVVFDGGDNTNATANNGLAGLDAGSAPLSIVTPFLGDRAIALTPGQSALLPRLALATTGTLTITGGTGTRPTIAGTPGARLALSGRDISITDTRVVATAGTLDVSAAGGITLAGAGSLETPGYAKVFGDAADPVTRSAPGGLLRLTAGTGNIALGSGTTVSVGGGAGASGDLRIVAANGTVTAAGKIDATSTDGGGAFTLLSRGAFDLGQFATNSATGFDRAIDIRSGADDLVLASGQSLEAGAVGLTADNGLVTIAGTIDTSGVNGGDIALYGGNGVTLTGQLLARATGYAATDSRQASGGAVTIGTDGTGTINLAGGSVIDVSATRPGDRLVTDIRNTITYYRFAFGDQGGTVAIRAPIIEAASGNSVRVSAAGIVRGAREVSVEGFKRFDLGALALTPGSGVTVAGGVATINVGTAGPANVFAGTGAGSIPTFVQGFNLTGSAAALAGLGTYVARPGIELDYTGAVTLASNWNFGAGTVDIPAAVAAGDIAANPALAGQFYVVPGREADLLQRFTRFTYRVDGRAEREAGVLSIRASGPLAFGRNTSCGTTTDCDGSASLTDGFFAFRDQTTPQAISYARGNGARLRQPLVPTDCPFGDCTVVAPFNPAAIVNPRGAITINLSLLGSAGDVPIPPGYNDAANSAAPVSGDPIGTAEIFPLLATSSGTRAIGSWSYRLVGGADLAARAGAPSANPLATTTDPLASVSVRGETAYSAAITAGPFAFSGAPQIDIAPASSGGGTPTPLPNFAAAFAANNEVALNATTLITLAGPQSSRDPVGLFLNAQATRFFATRPGRFGLDARGNTAVATTLEIAGQFLQSIASEYVAEYGAVLAARPVVVLPGRSTTQYVRTRVRTGTGSIAIAAAGDIDLTNGPVITRVSGASPLGQVQVGGTAVYTAGAPADLRARTVIDPAGVTRVVAPTDLTPSAFAGAVVAPVADALAVNPTYLSGGGAVVAFAGGAIAGRRDIQGGYRTNSTSSFVGQGGTPYRVGSIAGTLDLRTNPQLFQSGIGALGGGAVRVSAGSDVSDVAIVENSSVATANVTGGGLAPTLAVLTTGGGVVDVTAARDVVAGEVTVGAGSAVVRAGRDVVSAGTLVLQPGRIPELNGARFLVTDATVVLSAQGRASIFSLGAYGPNNFYSPTSAFMATSNGRFGFDYVNAAINTRSSVLPASLEVTSTQGDIDLLPLRNGLLSLYPSAIGQLNLYAGANVTPITLTQSDADPATSLTSNGELTLFATVSPAFLVPLSSTTDSGRRAMHNRVPTHLGDPLPVHIYAGGDIQTLRLATPKQTRVYAGRDVLNAAVFAQNLNAGDISRVVAGRDLIATNVIGQRFDANANAFVGAALPIAQGNVFVIGGPGTLFVEAGRDAGPFLTSVVATAPGGARQTLGGGVLSVGNEYNPWLQPVGANLVVQFGTAPGVNYAGLRDTYVDPANVANLADDLFAQNIDQFGRSVADRTQPIYAPVLIAWAQANAASELIAAYGTTNVTAAQAYTVFQALPELRQRRFLIEQVYFNELTQTSIPTSVSYLRYSRGYRAVNTLFPPTSGYTANDLSGGGGTGTMPVETGNLDLRLATIQTSRGGTIDILGPGGRVLGGSTVRTSAQAARRLTIAERVYDGFTTNATVTGDSLNANPRPTAITSIPTGFEGVITLRGGAVNGFVDQNFLLNQSRLFTEAGGDVSLWSSNGDLNAGQGPRTSANFPPIVVRVGPNATSEVDALGGVTGAGIAAFQPAPGTPAPNVYLIAPRGTVDAGDAGVRVAGNLFVAALSVANADNFSVGGQAFGIPSGPVVNTAAAAASSSATAAAVQAATAASSNANRRTVDPLSRISVEVLGLYGSDPCNAIPRPANCPVR